MYVNLPNVRSDSPAWECLEYRTLKYKWAFIDDMFEGRSRWVTPLEGIKDFEKASRYLPKMSQEPIEEWHARLKRAYWKGKFKQAVISSSGFLAEYSFNEEVSESIRENESNIDGRGNSLRLLLEQADQKALKDEHCFILVDFPPLPRDESGRSLITDAATERQFSRRPYLVLIDAIDVINWETSWENGFHRLEQVTIRETYTKKTGRFSNETKIQYRVLYPGGYEIWRGDTTNELNLYEEGQTTFDEIPLVVYSVTDDGDVFSGDPPLYQLAELDLNIYQTDSNKSEILLKTCLPVYQINELNYQNKHPDDAKPAISLGPNAVLWNVDSKIIEPSGSSIAELQADIDRMLLQAQQMMLAFQSGHYSPPTATEVNAASSNSRASLVTMARAKESSVAKIFRYWALWMRESNVGGINVDRTLIQTAMEAAQSQLLMGLRERGDLSREGLFKLLQLGRVFPPEFNVEEEIKRIERDINLAVEERQARVYDLLLKHQVVDADEVARAIAEGKPLSEVIDMERRENERLETFPEGFVASQGPSGISGDLQPSSDELATGGSIGDDTLF
jgi:hypothetical protein